jgi:hypothetical protein
LFRDHGLLIQKYDGSSRDATVKLNRIHACTKIHGVSQLYRKKALITGLDPSIGEVVAVDMNNLGLDGGEFV